MASPIILQSGINFPPPRNFTAGDKMGASMAKLIFTGAAAAIGIFAFAGLVFAQKNQPPWDDYRVEGGLTTIHVQGNV
jgi:hypothetical protein